MENVKGETGRLVHLIGDVHLYDDKVDIRGQQAWFSDAQNSLIVTDSIIIKTKDVTITADSMYFDISLRIAHLFRRVEVNKATTEITSPELIINLSNETSRVPFGARIRDTEEGIVISGDDLDYDFNAASGSLKRNPMLSDDNPNPEFWIKSKTMFLNQKNHTAEANEKVHIWADNSNVHCDYVILHYRDNYGNASGNISLISSDGNITADSANFVFKERRIQKIDLLPQVTTKYRTEGRDSVILTSKFLSIDLRKKKHEVLTFTGGANGTYYWTPEAEKAKHNK